MMFLDSDDYLTDNYVLEKQKLFKMTNNSFAVINSDDKYNNYFRCIVN